MDKYTDRDSTPLNFHRFYVALTVLRIIYGLFLFWSAYGNENYRTNIVTGPLIALINLYILINSSAWKKSVLACIVVHESFFAIAMMTLARMYVQRAYDQKTIMLCVVFLALGMYHVMTLSYYIKRRKLFNGKTDQEIEYEKNRKTTIPSSSITTNNDALNSNGPTKSISTEKQPFIHSAVSQTANVKMPHTSDARGTNEAVIDKEKPLHSKGSEPNRANLYDAGNLERNEKIAESETKRLSQIKFCRKCGFKLNEGELFCRKCGAKL